MTAIITTPSKINSAYYVRSIAYAAQQIFFPYLIILLLSKQLIGVAEVAIVSSMGVFSLRVTALLAARITSINHKKYVCLFCYSILCFLLLLSFYFVQIGINNVFIWLLLNIAIGGLFSIGALSTMSIVAINTDPDHYNVCFAKIVIAITVGNGLGYFIGSRVIENMAEYLPLIAGFFVLLSLLFSFWLPKDKSFDGATDKFQITHLNKNFRLFLFINFLTIFAYSHYYDIFPLFANDNLGIETVGNFYLINTGIVIALQLLVIKLVSNFNYNITVIISNLLYAIGMFSLILAEWSLFYIVLFGFIISSIAEMIFTPIYHTLSLKLYSNNDAVRPLAFMVFTWGIAEASAIFIGVNLVGQGFGVYSYFLAGTTCLLVAAICASKYSPLNDAQLKSH